LLILKGFPYILALMLMALSPASGEDLSLGKILEMALQHQAGERAYCPVAAPEVESLAHKLSDANEIGERPEVALGTRNSTPAEIGPKLTNPVEKLYCASLLLAEWNGAEARLGHLKLQTGYQDRLIRVESKRAFLGVDSTANLLEARRLRSRTELESASLIAEEAELHNKICNFFGIAVQDCDRLNEILPEVDFSLATAGSRENSVRAIKLYEDITQMDYAIERSNRLRAMEETALGKSSIGVLLMAHIQEEMKAITLARAEEASEVAALAELKSTGKLEGWLASQSSEKSSEGDFTSREQVVTGSSLQSLMLTPRIESLRVGETAQLMAIETDTNGMVSDATARCQWKVNHGKLAILSSAGALTAIKPGRILVSVEFEGWREVEEIEIVPEVKDEILDEK